MKSTRRASALPGRADENETDEPETAGMKKDLHEKPQLMVTLHSIALRRLGLHGAGRRPEAVRRPCLT